MGMGVMSHFLHSRHINSFICRDQAIATNKPSRLAGRAIGGRWFKSTRSYHFFIASLSPPLLFHRRRRACTASPSLPGPGRTRAVSGLPSQGRVSCAPATKTPDWEATPSSSLKWRRTSDPGESGRVWGMRAEISCFLVE